ncbi:MAG: aldo/keto reductase [Brevefilum sp.]|nr:aldo/keto reductase [Brevefilum sp.]MDT8382351.1 aldo/keto reductase [Brevefilum sp.]MDW7755993.1 aldo/keto reductase [Brevefilum sp.]
MMVEIEKRILGKSGIEVTKIGVGLWAIGGDQWGEVDDRDSLDMIDAALDLGINFFDTADVYGGGHSEKLLGKAMKGRRDKFVVATKIGWRDFDGEKGKSAYDTVEKLIAGVESNLERLQTDYVDVIQSHIDFHEPNMEIFVEGFQKLQAQGKVRAYGVSTSDFKYLQAFNADNKASTLQIDYSILNRTPEQNIFPYTLENDLGVLVRGPLAMGILTGKFTKDTRFEDGDFRQNWIKNKDEHQVFLNDLEKVEKLKPLTNGRSMAQLAIQFVMHHPAVTLAIPGAKRISQLKENVKAALLPELTLEELALIDSITPPGGGRKIWPA